VGGNDMNHDKTVLKIYGPNHELQKFAKKGSIMNVGLVPLIMRRESEAHLKASWKKSLTIEQKKGCCEAAWDKTAACHEYAHRVARVLLTCVFVLETYDSQAQLENIDIIRGNEILYSSSEEDAPIEELILMAKGVWYSGGNKFPSLIGCPLCNEVMDTEHWNTSGMNIEHIGPGFRHATYQDC
jgi:hypothetical protein